MKQTLFDTRQRANELTEEAVNIWRHSENADFTDGLDKDPVFSMLMMALAYQANEADSDIESLRQEITEDFAKMLTPYEAGHAIPATATIETIPEDSASEVEVNENSVFRLSPDYSFMPLFRSRILNVRAGAFERLDGRRWKVALEFKHPVSDLSGFCFMIRDTDFRSVNIRIKGNKLPLINPWNYSELPFVASFDHQSMTYNHGQFYSASMLPLDLFARQNVRLFWIDNNPSAKLDSEKEQLDLVFEFTGTGEDFTFGKEHLSLNTIVLVNAKIRDVTLTSSTPMARIAGYSDTKVNDHTSRQFLHLIRPPENLIYADTELEVRRVSCDRFNQGRLIKLLTSIVNKYHTDFYAFQNLRDINSGSLVYDLQEILRRMIQASQKDCLRNMTGVYLLLHDRAKIKNQNFSLTVKYLTTTGAGINHVLQSSASFIPPAGLDASRTRQITDPVPGLDEANSETATSSLLRYYMLTGDRIVTTADIKTFCYKELLRQYGIDKNLIRAVMVNRRLSHESSGPGYEICADIVLAGTGMIRRSFSSKIATAEILFQKMMEARSSGIYPIRVRMTIEG